MARSGKERQPKKAKPAKGSPAKPDPSSGLTREQALFEKRLLATEEKRKRQLAEARYQKAISRFRPRKGEKGSIVFLSSSPRKIPLPPGKKSVTIAGKTYKKTPGKNYATIPAGERVERGRKGYAVYITRSGKKRAYKEFDRERRRYEAPKPVLKSEVSPRFTRSKRAEAKWYSQFEVSERSKTGGLKQTRRGLDLYRDIYPKVARDLKTEADRQGPVAVLLKVTLAFTWKNSETGEVGTITGKEILFRQSWNQRNKPLSFYYNFIRYSLWPVMGDALADQELVTEGSAAYIAELDRNVDEENPSKWQRADGLPWAKWDYGRVIITSFDYRIGVVRVTNKPKNKGNK